ncbi:MAG: zinc ribbon domain-containing protein [Promicromonosporaceae bacterium]|nr:zinc ribbon domain-containing protein [Promicromonosporaceae bacterium]
MASVPDATACVTCGGSARRLFTAPFLGRGSSAAMKTIDATKASSETPQVVTALPSQGSRRRTQPVTRNPLHQGLPRP